MKNLTPTQARALEVLKEFYDVDHAWEFGPVYDPITGKAISLATVRALVKAEKIVFVNEGVLQYKVKGAYGRSISWKKEKTVYFFQWP